LAGFRVRSVHTSSGCVRQPNETFQHPAIDYADHRDTFVAAQFDRSAVRLDGNASAAFAGLSQASGFWFFMARRPLSLAAPAS
jgi:hypothetical protein